MSENTSDMRKDPPLKKAEPEEDLETGGARPPPARRISHAKPTHDVEDTEPPQVPRHTPNGKPNNTKGIKGDPTLTTLSPDIEQGILVQNDEDPLQTRTQDSESSLPRRASGGLVPRDLREPGNSESIITDAATVVTPRELGDSDFVMTSVATDATTVVMGNTSSRRRGANASSFATTLSSMSGTDAAHPGAVFLSTTEFGIDDMIVEEENGQESAERTATKSTLASEGLVEDSGGRRPFFVWKRFVVIAIAVLLVIGGAFAAVYFLVLEDGDSDSSAASSQTPLDLENEEFRDLALTFTGLTQLNSTAIEVWERVSADHFIDAYARNRTLGITIVTTAYKFQGQSDDPPLQIGHHSIKAQLQNLTIFFKQNVSYFNESSGLNELELAQYPFGTEALRDTYMQKLRGRDPATFASVTSVSMEQTPAATSEPTPSPTPEFTLSPTPELTLPPTPETTSPPTPETLGPFDDPTPEPSIPGPSPEPTPYPTPTPLLEGEWTQLGEDLLGEAHFDWFGQSVAMSADGNIVAVGAPQNDGENSTNEDGGSVYVHVWNGTTEAWEPMGEVLRGDNEGDRFGTSVALSGDGLTLAVGAPASNGSRPGYVRVYRRINSTWVQQGLTLNGTNNGDEFGSSFALSANGSTLAVGASGSGQVGVFRLESNSWSPIGSSFDGGASVALSYTGSTLVVGGSGLVRVFQILDNSLVLVIDLSSDTRGDGFGSSVALSGDGIWLAVGAFNYDGNGGQNSGLVRVFRLSDTGNTWNPAGFIEGGDEFHRFGFSTALSTNGAILAVGAPGNNNQGYSYTGYMRIYQYLNDGWEQIGDTISGNEEEDLFGWSIALSSDGRTVVGGGRQKRQTGANRPGYALVYHLQEEKEGEELAQIGPVGK